VRHGKPAVDRRTPIAGVAFGAWIQTYNEAPLDVTYLPPASLRARVPAMGCIATSPLRRSRESAVLLAPGRPLGCDALFVEAGSPHTTRLRLRLPPVCWSFLFRMAWFCGWSQDAESLREARQRAQRAAERLVELAREHQSVILIGHGQLNRMISHVLLRMGWHGSRSGHAYWSVGDLRLSPD
jgi:broad specificity phosphatase PhoE